MREEPTVVRNGDILTDVRLSDLIEFHQANDAAVSMGLVRVPDPIRYGVAELDAESRVLRFLEKPQGKVTPNTINAGIFPRYRNQYHRVKTDRSSTTFSPNCWSRTLVFIDTNWRTPIGVTSAHSIAVSLRTWITSQGD